MRANTPNIPKLREQLNVALRSDKFHAALELCDQLAAAEPLDPRWPQRRGDLHRRLNADAKAVECYELAVDLYAKQGFVARAAAMAKLILQIDETRLDVLERVDPDEARRLHRLQRSTLVTAVSDGSSLVPQSLPIPQATAPVAAPPLPPPLHQDAPAPPPIPTTAALPPLPPPTPRGAQPGMPPSPAASPGLAPTAAAATASAVASESPPESAIPPLPPPAPRPKRKSLSMSAVTLEPILDVEDDELRFSEVDEDEAIDIDLSAMELDDLSPVARADEDGDQDDVLLFDDDDDDDDDHRRSAAQLAALPSISLFAEIPPAALSRLIQHAELVELGRGEHLIRAGDPADALFVIVSGDLEVDWPELDAPIPVGEGSIVGETCLLDAVARRADVRTVTRVSALRIPKSVITEIVAEFPAVDEVLLELLTRRLIGNLLRTNPLFIGFDPETRAELARLFEVRRAPLGTELFVQGKKTDGLYVPLLGHLDVQKDGQVLGRVRLGTAMGQSALFTRAPAESTVVAVTDTLVLRLPAGRFNELAALYPTALMHLTEQADSVDGEHISIFPDPA